MDNSEDFFRKEKGVFLDPADKLAIRAELQEFMAHGVRNEAAERPLGVMDNSNTDFLRLAQTQGLSADDKMQAKIRLRAFMQQHAPAASRESEGKRAMAFFSLFSGLRLSALAMALVLVVAAGGGVAYAAETSMPGGALYGVKRGLNERVMLALAFDAQAKAGAHSRLVQRRLREIEYLALRAGGDADRDEDLRANLEFHMMTAQEQIAELAKEEPDAATAETARLEAELEAHATILSQLEPSSSPDIRPFLMSVNTAVTAAAKTATDTRVNFEGASAAAARISAEATIEQSERGIAEARRALDRMDGIADPRSLLRAKKVLEEAEDDLTAGKATLEAEGYGEAVIKGKSARRRAEESRVIGASTSAGIEMNVGTDASSDASQTTSASDASSMTSDAKTSGSSERDAPSAKTSASRSALTSGSSEKTTGSSATSASVESTSASQNVLEGVISSTASGLPLP